jgi:hypothetical protein
MLIADALTCLVYNLQCAAHEITASRCLHMGVVQLVDKRTIFTKSHIRAQPAAFKEVPPII